ISPRVPVLAGALTMVSLPLPKCSSRDPVTSLDTVNQMPPRPSDSRASGAPLDGRKATVLQPAPVQCSRAEPPVSTAIDLGLSTAAVAHTSRGPTGSTAVSE